MCFYRIYTPIMKTMMRIFFSCIIIYSSLSKAENKLLLCTSYDNDGNYTGDFPSWKINRTGNFMYVLYQSDTPLNDSLYISLEKTFNRKDSNYYQYDHYYLVPGATKKFAVNKYIFTKPGNYRISVYDRLSEALLKTYTTAIGYTDQEYADKFFTDTWYYNESVIYFCDSLVNSKLIGKSDVFSYQPQREKIVLYVEQLNKISLKTDHLFVKVFNRENHQLVQSSSYSIHNEWYWTFISIYIKDRGKYTVELYNEDDVFINQADLEIK